MNEHGYTTPDCGLCGQVEPSGGDFVDPRRIYAHVRVLTDPVSGDEFLACRDDERTCADLAQRRQAELDRAAYDTLGIATPRPLLRLIKLRLIKGSGGGP